MTTSIRVEWTQQDERDYQYDKAQAEREFVDGLTIFQQEWYRQADIASRRRFRCKMEREDNPWREE